MSVHEYINTDEGESENGEETAISHEYIYIQIQ